MEEQQKDYDKAEEYYQRAVEADPKHANILGNYANFLCDQRKDYDKAEEYYQRAVEADPKHANILGNYANFLCDQRKDDDKAEEYYRRAVEANPKDANNLGNYAVFLKNQRKDYDLSLIHIYRKHRSVGTEFSYGKLVDGPALFHASGCLYLWRICCLLYTSRCV